MSVMQGVIVIKELIQRYKKSRLSDDRGGPNIFVLGAFAIFFLLGLFTTLGYAYKLQTLASDLNTGIKIAATTAFGHYTIPETDRYGTQVIDADSMQQEFRDILQGQMRYWPESTYILQSFQVYDETDRGLSPPTGFLKPIPGTSVYIKVDLKLKVNLGYVPVSTSWTVPLNIMASSNSYESATGAWNLAR